MMKNLLGVFMVCFFNFQCSNDEDWRHGEWRKLGLIFNEKMLGDNFLLKNIGLDL